MFRLTRNGVVSAVICAVGVTVLAAAHPDAVNLRKQDTLRQALQALGRNPEDRVLALAATRATALLDVSVLDQGDAVLVTLVFSDAPQWRRVETDGAHTFAVDLYNTLSLTPAALNGSAGRLLAQATAELRAIEPAFITRLAWSTASACRLESVATGNTLRLLLRPENGGDPVRERLDTAEQRLREHTADVGATLAARWEAHVRDLPAGEASSPYDPQELAEDAQQFLASVDESVVRQRSALRAIEHAWLAGDAGVEATFAALDAWSAGLAHSLSRDRTRLAAVNPAPADESGLVVAATAPVRFETVDLAQAESAWEDTRVYAAVDGEATQAEVEEAAPADPAESAPPPRGQTQERSQAPPARTAPVAATTASTRSSSPPAGVDPLYQPITIDFREMELNNVVALLAQKAQINVIAGEDVSLQPPVTAYLQNVPLITAMETVLRMNDLGLVEEEGIFRIVPYQDAVAARRMSRMVQLENAQAAELQSTLDDVVQGMPDSSLISVASSVSTNTLIISGPEKQVEELVELTYQLDVAEPTLATVTEAIKLNYADPLEVIPVVESMLTPDDIGKVEADVRSRSLIVTDLPVVIGQVRGTVESIDQPVRQVAIEAMIIDAVLRDASQTGVNWLLDLVRRRDRTTGEAIDVLSSRQNKRGQIIGSMQDLSAGANLGNIGATGLDAGVLTYGVLTDSLDFRGAIAAEVQSRNAEILANPVVVTVENKQADISIVQDFPYQEITQSTQGPPVASTAFKEIGIELSVIPRVTHEDDIIVQIDTKQSSISGLTEDGIPIEDKRTAQTTLRSNDGKTIFIGGLRNIFDRNNVSKIPVLGDVPVINFMFRNTDIEKIHTELLIFLTCHVVEDDVPELSLAHQVEVDKIKDVPRVPDSQRAMFRQLVRPGEMRDPAWKWRRSP